MINQRTFNKITNLLCFIHKQVVSLQKIKTYEKK